MANVMNVKKYVEDASRHVVREIEKLEQEVRDWKAEASVVSMALGGSTSADKITLGSLLKTAQQFVNAPDELTRIFSFFRIMQSGEKPCQGETLDKIKWLYRAIVEIGSILRIGNFDKGMLEDQVAKIVVEITRLQADCSAMSRAKSDLSDKLHNEELKSAAYHKTLTSVAISLGIVGGPLNADLYHKRILGLAGDVTDAQSKAGNLLAELQQVADLVGVKDVGNSKAGSLARIIDGRLCDLGRWITAAEAIYDMLGKTGASPEHLVSAVRDALGEKRVPPRWRDHYRELARHERSRTFKIVEAADKCIGVKTLVGDAKEYDALVAPFRDGTIAADGTVTGGEDFDTSYAKDEKPAEPEKLPETLLYIATALGMDGEKPICLPDVIHEARTIRDRLLLWDSVGVKICGIVAPGEIAVESPNSILDSVRKAFIPARWRGEPHTDRAFTYRVIQAADAIIGCVPNSESIRKYEAIARPFRDSVNEDGSLRRGGLPDEPEYPHETIIDTKFGPLSVWSESGRPRAHPPFDRTKFGPHAWPESGTGECSHGCGCWMGKFYSRGPFNPLGPCPNNPRK